MNQAAQVFSVSVGADFRHLDTGLRKLLAEEWEFSWRDTVARSWLAPT